MSQLYDHKSMMQKLDALIVGMEQTSRHVSMSIQGLSDKIRETNNNVKEANSGAETFNRSMFWLTVVMAASAAVQAVDIILRLFKKL